MREMKISVVGIIVVCFALLALGQDKPLTQTEYVKLLYGLQKDPSSKQAIVEALRKRGIDFVVTDGIRSLTRSKGANDDELKRALEEADRRRQNPETSKLPSEKEANEILNKARESTLSAMEEMPDFVVKQQISRAYAYAGTGKYIDGDNLLLAVSYSDSRGEENKVLSINGIIQETLKPAQFSEVGGYTSIGEFVGFLSGVFKSASETKFRLVDTDLLRGRKCIVWEYEINAAKATYQIASGGTRRVIQAGYRGKIWIDRENFRVLRFDMQATEIPSDYPVRSVKRTIDYEWVTISDEKYLLPMSADVSLISKEQSMLLESRNRSRFKNYQKYGSEVRILDDDITPTPEPTPVKPD